ncbi:hypothetical protein VS868_14085 [Salinimicrobium sp. 3283s]|uniref:hypothetical protein n=1 Tax=Salinimicrobium sp. 3283s TaxID=3114359 RepID=UPI0031EF71AD
MIEGLKDNNLDWLFFGRTHIWPLKDSKNSRVLTYFKIIGQIIRSFFLRKKKSKKYHGGLLFIDNSRHYDQAKVISEQLDNLLYHNNTKQDLPFGKRVNLTKNIYFNYKYLIKYFPKFFKEELSKDSKIFKSNLSLSIYGILLYENYLRFFKDNKISYVVIFTDHTYKNRALMYAAKKCKVKTVYIPHASVSQKFPPLETDIAFMEGRDMKMKYMGINKKFNLPLRTELIYSGNIKINSRRLARLGIYPEKIIGIAFNKLDSINKVEQFVDEILSNNIFREYRIRLRPHPGVDYKLKGPSDRVSLSENRYQSSIDFIESIEFLLSGDSNIILEAILLKTPSYILPFSNSFQDNYSFIKNGLCPFIGTIGMLAKYNKELQFEYNDDVIQEYDYSWNTGIDSVNLIAKTLNE